MRLFSILSGDWIQVSQRWHFGRIAYLTYEWRLPTVASLPPVIKVDQNLLLLFFFVVLRFDPRVSCVLQKHSAIELHCCPLPLYFWPWESYWPWPHCDAGRPLSCNLLTQSSKEPGLQTCSPKPGFVVSTQLPKSLGDCQSWRATD